MIYETKEELEKGNYTELKSYPNIEKYAHHGRAYHVEQVIHCIKASTTRILLCRKDSAITAHSGKQKTCVIMLKNSQIYKTIFQL